MNPRIIGIIQARSGSTRFPGKTLQPVGGLSLLGFQINRLRLSSLLTEILVATTGSPKDDVIAAECERLRVPCFRGSERDVLDRYYRAAQQAHADIIVRLTADCPWIDPAVVDRVIATYQEGSYDYVANTAPPPGTYPDGMDVEVFSLASLKEAWEQAEKISEREHVTFFFWKQPNRFRLHRVEAPEDLSHIRLTVDYPEDMVVVRRLADQFADHPDIGIEKIVAFLKSHPEVINASRHTFGEGWKPALDKDASLREIRKAPALSLAMTETAWEKAIKIVPTGAQTFSKSPGQFVKGVAPKMLVRGRGCRVWDLDGNEYIDYTLGLGPAILGHCHPEVVQAAAQCAADLFCAPPLPHPLETRLGEKIQTLIPAAEMVKFGKNGSDVTAGAVRLARAFTGRDLIACCGYHGWQDWYIGSTSRRKGVPEAVQKLTKTFEYNRIDSIQRLFRDNPGQIAAVILEPVTFFPPVNNFLHELRDLCTREGALLIFDEVITGFRLSMNGAQGVFGVAPDLSTFGKAIANGFPLSVLCGKEKFMRLFEEVFVSFTFAGELPSIAAALKTLEILEEQNGVQHIAWMGKNFRESFNRIAQSLGMDYIRCIGLDFWPEYVFDDVKGFSALELLSLLQQEVVRRGILTRAAPFISCAHGLSDLRETIHAYQDALTIVHTAVRESKVCDWLDGEVIEPVIRSEQHPSQNAVVDQKTPVA